MPRNLYPAPKYEVWLYNPEGTRIAFIDRFSALSFSRAFGTIGRFSMTLPYSVEFATLVNPYNMIHITRTPHAGQSRLEFGGFINRIEYADQNGQDNLILSGVDGIDILKSRIIAYRSGDAKASYSGSYTSFAIDQTIDNQLGSIATDTLRNIKSYGFYIQGSGAIGIGAPINMKFAWKNLLDVINNMCAVSYQKGYPIYYDIIPIVDNNRAEWVLVTFADQLGVDRSYTGSSVTLFSKDFGNLENSRLVYDYADEITYAYVGGEGEAAARELGTAYDADRVYRTPWSRREKFVNFSSQENATALTDRAEQAVREGKPRITFTGNLKDSLQTRYGLDWHYGDKVAIKYLNKSFTGLVNAIAISLNERKQEIVTARVEAEL